MLFLIFFLYLEKEKDAEREGKREGLRAKEIFVERARGAKRGVALSDNPLVQSSCVHPIVYCAGASSRCIRRA